MELLERAQLVVETKSMDELQKDMLILHAQNDSMENLRTHYPSLPAQKLDQLHIISRGSK